MPEHHTKNLQPKLFDVDPCGIGGVGTTLQTHDEHLWYLLKRVLGQHASRAFPVHSTSTPCLTLNLQCLEFSVDRIVYSEEPSCIRGVLKLWNLEQAMEYITRHCTKLSEANGFGKYDLWHVYPILIITPLHNIPGSCCEVHPAFRPGDAEPGRRITTVATLSLRTAAVAIAIAMKRVVLTAARVRGINRHQPGVILRPGPGTEPCSKTICPLLSLSVDTVQSLIMSEDFFLSLAFVV